ncbi:hypothetical protein BC835DRAFT_78594 [Cytidiella melzeri]|nr:hypothetical protein BC835DRAFT_78594 [Cytidiella melzeri]
MRAGITGGGIPVWKRRKIRRWVGYCSLLEIELGIWGERRVFRVFRGGCLVCDVISQHEFYRSKVVQRPADGTGSPDAHHVGSHLKNSLRCLFCTAWYLKLFDDINRDTNAEAFCKLEMQHANRMFVLCTFGCRFSRASFKDIERPGPIACQVT